MNENAKNSPLVIDLLGGAIGTLTPPRVTPTAYGKKLTDAGVNAIAVTTALYARDIRPVLKEIFDYYCLFEQASDRLMAITTADDVLTAKRTGRLGVILGVQGLQFIEEETTFIPILARLGLRVATLTYNEQTQFGAGCMETEDRGLTLLGLRVIQEMNRSGVLVDISHAGYKTSLDMIAASTMPVVATHANAVAVTPNIRNLKDDQIKAVAKTGGVIGISPYSPFIAKPGKRRPDIEDFFDHLDYVAKLVGVEHVAIGTDFFPHSKIKWENGTRRMYPQMAGDFVFETLYAEGLEDHPDMPALPKGLARRGYGARDIEAILGGNAMRVFRAVWPKAQG